MPPLLLSLLVLLVVLLLLEVGIAVLAHTLRKGFPWIITRADERPRLDPVALRKFLDTSHDPRLGWVRRPNSSGKENGKKGVIEFHVDALGSRRGLDGETAPTIAVFGDSYAFCRQVEDDETWEAQLSRLEGTGVLNFGVGNYGVDQAVLRYEATPLPDPVRVVILNFVPETVCRIQSYWKHYLEFGNTFAFKPRFRLGPAGELILVENAMKGEADFLALEERLPEIQRHDGFYLKKFRAQQFRFPYTASLLRNPSRNARVLGAVLSRRLGRALGSARPGLEDLPFAAIMKSNLLDAYREYADEPVTALFRAILLRFRDRAIAEGRAPLVLVTPQLLDLKLNRERRAPYDAFFGRFDGSLPVIDFTEPFKRHGDLERLYINDQYGGHLSVDGNRLVAERVAAWLRTEPAGRPAAPEKGPDR